MNQYLGLACYGDAEIAFTARLGRTDGSALPSGPIL